MAISSEFETQDLSVYCRLKVNGKEYGGWADCHPNDFFSQRVGERISYNRASVDYLKDERHNICEQIKSLKHLLSIYDQSAKTNKNSYEYRMLQKQINAYTKDLNDLRQAIKDIKEMDIEYVKERTRILEREKTLSNNKSSPQ